MRSRICCFAAVFLIVILLMSVSAEDLAPGVLKGVVMYDEKPISLITKVSPLIYCVDANTGKMVKDIKYTYDNTTAAYQIEGLPQSILRIVMQFVILKSEPTLPGNYDAFVYLEFDKLKPEERAIYQINARLNMHLVAPYDNAKADLDIGVYPVLAGGITAAWEAVPGARRYSLSVIRCRDAAHPEGYGFIDVAFDRDTEAAALDLTLAPSNPDEHYELVVRAWNVNSIMVGQFVITYTGGYGWDFRFKVK